MSWHFSRALVAEYSAASCSGGALCAPLSGSHTLLGFCSSDKTMEFFRRSRSGMTFEPLTEDRGEALLTLFLADSHAKTSAPQARAQASTASAPACGGKWQGLLARYDPVSCSWKTPQCSLFADSEPSLETWPRWGSMRNGECWERIPSVPTTSENESGYWPTPTADSVTERTQRYAQDGMPLTAAVRMFPTATATAYKGWSPNHNRADSDDRLDYTVEREAFLLGQTTPPKRLNPDWVEWLIGWPIGHTALKPLETDKFREWQRQHGGCSMSGEVDPNRPQESAQTEHPRHFMSPLLGTMIDK